MALRITTDLVKFKNMTNDLGLPLYKAIGLLESIWHFTAKNAIRGDIGRHTNKEIADWIGWEGDADEMIKVLTARHWLDPHPKYRLVTHDWHQHADKSVKTIMRNRKMIFVQEEKLTEVPKEIIGHPETQIGFPPESREQSAGAEVGVQRAESSEAASLAQDFHFWIPGKSKPFLLDLTAEFQAKLDWLGAHGRIETEHIRNCIKDPKRDKTAANSIGKMWHFWNYCGFGDKSNERSKRNNDTAPGGGRYEGLEAPAA